jgi:hypothetical protein
MHCASRAVIGLRQLDCVVSEALAVGHLLWCCSDTSFEALASALPHVGLQPEESLHSLYLQDGAQALAANPACIGSLTAAAAG